MSKNSYDVDIETLEDFILNKYNCETLNTDPSSDSDLLIAYIKNTDYIHQYLRATVDDFFYSSTNELRAALGHLAEFVIQDGSLSGENLNSAYGHLRRLNIDGLKLLCDEFDKELSVNLKKQYGYDYRDVSKDYLKEYGEKYFKAKKLYREAQQKESVGCDRKKHNVIKLYYDAAKEYIYLKKFAREKSKDILKVKSKEICRKIFCLFISLFGIIVWVLDYFF